MKMLVPDTKKMGTLSWYEYVSNNYIGNGDHQTEEAGIGKEKIARTDQ